MTSRPHNAEDRPLQIEARAGTLAADQQLEELPLISRGVKVGMLIVGLSNQAELAERVNLIDSGMPTVAMAVDDALTSSALADYRAALERKIEERTLELEKARDEIAENLVQLQIASAARERLFANVNHDLRTPLSLIPFPTMALAFLASCACSVAAPGRAWSCLFPPVRARLSRPSTTARCSLMHSVKTRNSGVMTKPIVCHVGENCGALAGSALLSRMRAE